MLNSHYNVDISYDSDSKGNTYQLISINGVLHTIFASCQICHTTVQAFNKQQLNYPKTLLAGHECINVHKEVKSFVCSVVKISQFF